MAFPESPLNLPSPQPKISLRLCQAGVRVRLKFQPTHKQPAILTCLGTAACGVDHASVYVFVCLCINKSAVCVCLAVSVVFFLLFCFLSKRSFKFLGHNCHCGCTKMIIYSI